jgi:putative sterol carrier protein
VAVKAVAVKGNKVSKVKKDRELAVVLPANMLMTLITKEVTQMASMMVGAMDSRLLMNTAVLKQAVKQA